MSEWILSVCGMIFLTAILNTIIPQGKTSKIIKSVFAIMCVSVLIKPVLDLKNVEFDFKTAFSSAEINMQDGFLYFTLNEKEKFLGNSVCEYLIKEGFPVVKADIELFYKDDYCVSTKKVKIGVKNVVISENDMNIDIIDRVYEYLSAFVAVDKNIIEIYE